MKSLLCAILLYGASGHNTSLSSTEVLHVTKQTSCDAYGMCVVTSTAQGTILRTIGPANTVDGCFLEESDGTKTVWTNRIFDELAYRETPSRGLVPLSTIARIEFREQCKWYHKESIKEHLDIQEQLIETSIIDA